MPTRLVHLVLDANDTPRLASFWAAALGWETEGDGDGEMGVQPAGFDYPAPGALPIVFVPVDQPKTAKNRVHLDLATQSLGQQAELVARLRDLGAKPVDIGQGDVPFVVQADPEGNEFCVLEPRDIYRGTGPVGAVVVDCADPAELGRFWALASGWPVHGSDGGYVSFRSPAGTGPYLELIRNPDPKTVKNRLHLDVAPFPGEDHEAEVERLRGAGAGYADVGQGSDVTWTVLADPEGNEFCVLSPR